MSKDERVAVVTGATGGLGRVVTRMLLERGMRVVANYRSDGKLRDLKGFLGPLGANVVYVKADVTLEAEVDALFKAAMGAHGRVDVLLNIAGGWYGGAEVQDIPLADWERIMDVNLKTTFLCSRAALAIMAKQGYGKIVSVASRLAVDKRSRAKAAAYAVSKAGIVVLTETMAEEAKRHGVNVHVVLPSTIDTETNRRNNPQADFSKWVRPEEIGKLMLFLISDDSRESTGAVVPIYGRV